MSQFSDALEATAFKVKANIFCYLLSLSRAILKNCCMAPKAGYVAEVRQPAISFNSTARALENDYVIDGHTPSGEWKKNSSTSRTQPMLIL